MYSGVSADATDYFAKFGHHCPTNFNPPDFLMDLLVHKQLNEQALEQIKSDFYLAGPVPADEECRTCSGSDNSHEEVDLEAGKRVAFEKKVVAVVPTPPASQSQAQEPKRSFLKENVTMRYAVPYYEQLSGNH